jgi:hypothetical protein
MDQGDFGKIEHAFGEARVEGMQLDFAHGHAQENLRHYFAARRLDDNTVGSPVISSA